MKIVYRFLIVISFQFMFSVVQGNKPCVTNVYMEKNTEASNNSLLIPWVRNEGQYHNDVAYHVQTFAGSVYLNKKNELVYDLPADSISSYVFKETFVNHSQHSTSIGISPSKAKVNYFISEDNKKWISSIETFESIDIGEIWDGIKVKLNSHSHNIEKLFYVEKDANVNQIRMELKSIDYLSISKSGELVLHSVLGEINYTAPKAWQWINNVKIEVKIEYAISNDSEHPTYGFTVGKYNPNYELIIDPLLASTFIGGNQDDITSGIAIDNTGNVYIIGQASGVNYPTTTGTYNNSSSGTHDIFISKFNNDFSVLLASSYIGGSNTDASTDIAIDNNGNVVITGSTYSSNYPVTSGAFDNSYSGMTDAFVSKLSSDLDVLLASTFIGGTDNDNATALAIDINGEVVITGSTGSTTSNGFPITNFAYDATQNGARDVYITKLNNNLSQVLASTYIGGLLMDASNDILIDNGNIFIAGDTKGIDYPTFNGVSNTSNGNNDVFLSKFSNDLSNLIASTYLGGSMDESSPIMDIDNLGNIFVHGRTTSNDFPTLNGFSNSFSNGTDSYITKLNNNLNSILASTFIGGSSDDIGYGISIDNSNNVYVSGLTNSSNFPVVCPEFTYSGMWDIYVSKLDNSLSNLLASTFIGGTVNDMIKDIEAYNGDIYIVGNTLSTNFPTAGTPYSNTHIGDGSKDAILFKFNLSVTNTAFNYPNIIYCSTDPNPTPTITGVNGGTFTINNGGVINISTGEFDLATSGIGVYEITYTLSNGCFETDTIEITNCSNTTTASFTVNHLALCVGDCIDFTDLSSTTDPGGIIGWNWDFTGANTLTSQIQNPTNICYNSAGSYSVTLSITTDDGSIDDTTLTISVLNYSDPTITSVNNYCAYNSTQSFSAINSTGIWSFNGSNSNTFNPAAVGVGNYELIHTISGMCGGADSIQIVINPVPDVQLSSELLSICSNENEEILLNSGVINANYLWQDGSINETFIVTIPGEYSVQVTDNNGCVNSDNIIVNNSCKGALWIANCFSPNNDGLNDLFGAIGNSIEEFNFLVFNRWGELLFQSNNIDDRWDGQYRGQLVATGTYLWAIEYKTPNDPTIKSLKGHVTLLR